MNKLSTIQSVREFTTAIYGRDSYVMTEADFLEPPEVSNINGRTYATGRTVLGDMRTIRLNVPLCVGCDKPISDDICVACETVFVGRPAPIKVRAGR